MTFRIGQRVRTLNPPINMPGHYAEGRGVVVATHPGSGADPRSRARVRLLAGTFVNQSSYLDDAYCTVTGAWFYDTDVRPWDDSNDNEVDE